MQLILDSCSTLGYSKTFEYIGDSFCFRHAINLNLQGTIVVDNWSGVTPIWSGISGVINNNQDYQNILINGQSFGSGILNSINFEEGVDVRTKIYTASVTTYQTGNLSFLTGVQFSGLSGLANFDLRNIQSISEDSTFETQGNLSYSFQRSFSLNLISGGSYANDNLINQSKAIAQVVLSGLVNLNSGFYDLPTGFNPKRIYSESYDFINGGFSFNESINYIDQNPYDWSYSHSLKQGDNGIVEVSENGSVIGVSQTYVNDAISGYLNSTTGAYFRCSGFFTDILGTDCGIINQPVSSTFSLDHNRGAIQYDISFSTDPRFSSTGCNWSYAHSLSRSTNGYSVSEQGDVIGVGTGIQKYNRAFSCFTGLSGNIYNRVSGYFQELSPNPECFSGVSLLSKSITDDEVQGRISYEFSYGTDNRYLGSGVYSFFSSGTDNSLPIHLKSTIPILNNINSDYVISNYRSNSSLGTFTFNNSFNISGLNFLQNAIYSSLPLLINTGSIPSPTFYLSDININFDVDSSIVQSSVNYSYVQNRVKNDILI